jgi:hypothetical protein
MKRLSCVLLLVLLAFGASIAAAGVRAQESTPVAPPPGCELGRIPEPNEALNIAVMPGTEFETEIPTGIENETMAVMVRDVVFGAMAHTPENCYDFAIELEVKQGEVTLRLAEGWSGQVFIWTLDQPERGRGTEPASNEIVLHAGDRASIVGAKHQLTTGAHGSAVVEVTKIMPSGGVSPCGNCVIYP